MTTDDPEPAPDELRPAVVLADIGGTNARFAVLQAGEVTRRVRRRVAAFAGPAEALRAYLDSLDMAPRLAVLAVAGPVTAGRARLTNAAWSFDAEALAVAAGLDRVCLVNDFVAQARAVPALAPDMLRSLGGGRGARGEAMLVLGPGTGLGVAALLPESGATAERVVAGEGGHATLAAHDEAQAALLTLLRRHHGRVSAERVLSGPGLAGLAQAVALRDGLAAAGDGPEAVLAAARRGEACARAAVAGFCDLLGGFAGDMALVFGARGGVYLAGGLAAAMAEDLPASTFRARFEAKGRFRAYMEAIPTQIVLHPDPAFLGLARIVAGSTP